MKILGSGEYTGEIVHQLDIEGSIITHTFYTDQQCAPEWHYHENLHICFVFQGGRSETKSQIRDCEATGNVLFYHAEQMHRWISPQPISKSVNIEIASSFLEKYQLKEAQIKSSLNTRIDAKTLMLKMQQEMLSKDVNYYSSVQSLLLELIAKPVSKENGKTPIWVNRLEELLHDNWNEELSLTEISHIIQVHPVTISKYFRKYFSCTLGEYRRKLKIEKSISLIKDSDMSLSDIAFHCGFADQSHFIRNFKAKTGFLPKDFRKY